MAFHFLSQNCRAGFLFVNIFKVYELFEFLLFKGFVNKVERSGIGHHLMDDCMSSVFTGHTKNTRSNGFGNVLGHISNNYSLEKLLLKILRSLSFVRNLLLNVMYVYAWTYVRKRCHLAYIFNSRRRVYWIEWTLLNNYVHSKKKTVGLGLGAVFRSLD